MFNGKMGQYMLWSGAVSKVDGNIWISLLECNGIIQVDIHTGAVHFVGCFEGENNSYQLYEQIVPYQNKLFFIPFNARNIAIYDLVKKEFHYLPANSSRKAGRFWSASAKGKYLYMTSYDSIQVVKMDMESEKIVNSFELENDYCGYDFQPIMLEHGIYKISGIKERNDLSWKFDLEKEELSLCEYTFLKGIKLTAGSRGNNCIWSIGDNNKLYQLSEKCEFINQYDVSGIVYRVMKDANAGLLKCIYVKNVLIIIFCDKCCMVKIPFVNNKLDIEESIYVKFNSAFFSIDENDLIVMLENSVIIINSSGEKRVNFTVDTNFFLDIYAKNDRLQEFDLYGLSLERYIKYICDIENNSQLSNNNVDVSTGKAIYDMVRI